MPLSVYTTVPRRHAVSIANKMVTKGLAACANIFDIKSVYVWKGRVHRNKESAIIFKSGKCKKLMAELKKIHPHDVPCIVSWNISHADRDYAKWLFTQSA